MTKRFHSTSKRLSIILVGLAGAALVLLTAVRVYQLKNDPEVPFLSAKAGAQWITIDNVVLFGVRPAEKR